MVAQRHQVQIDAIEIDTSAARQAEENVSASSWASKIKVHETDLLDFSPPQPYDIIISNPPFYEKELRSSESQRNIAHHSTQLSLRQLLQFIGLHLKEEGTFFLLLPYKREHEAHQLLQQEQLFLYEKWKVRQSLNHDFFRLLLKGGKQPQSETDHELSIRDAQQQYTADFINLVKDYYLYL
jgi:tRNA1Val (adenine37-N6)-methyltransferase